MTALLKAVAYGLVAFTIYFAIASALAVVSMMILLHII